jgi:hypothetical protein
MIVDWFDASCGDRVADIARSSLVLLGDGVYPPSHLPGSDPRTLAVLTEAYEARLRERLVIDDDLLARWRAINAAARLAEGVASEPLLEVWHRFAATGGAAPAAQAIAG